MSLILSYNDGLAKGKKRVPNIRKEPHIERGFTKFKLDYGKCRSYLDIHLPIFYNKSMCELTDAIIERCRAIMIRVLYNGSLDYNEDSVLDLSYGGWVSNMNKSQLFIEMFLKESIVMEIKTMHALDNEDELSWDSEDYSYYSLLARLFNRRIIDDVNAFITANTHCVRIFQRRIPTRNIRENHIPCV
jgi:hypothetical protein